jgi:uncharacterized protein
VTTIVDTGPLVASADRADKHHVSCANLLRHLTEQRERLVVPMTVVVEVCWLLEKYQGPDAEARFLDLISGGVFELAEISREDVGRMASLVRQYSGFPLGAVDASVIAVAERYGVEQIATIDRRHFTAVRPSHINAFKLLPE